MGVYTSLWGEQKWQWTPPSHVSKASVIIISLTLKQGRRGQWKRGAVDEHHRCTSRGEAGLRQFLVRHHYVHEHFVINNPLSCVVSQDVPGPPTRKVQVSITYCLHCSSLHPPCSTKKPDWAEPLAQRCSNQIGTPGLLSGCCYALILLDRGGQPALAAVSHTAGMRARAGRNLGSKLLMQGC